MQYNAEICRFGVGEHGELDLCRSFVIVKLVFTGTVGYEADAESLAISVSRAARFACADLFSSPAIRPERLRNENITPNINFASSSLDSSFRWLVLISPLLAILVSDCGLVLLALEDTGRGSHLLWYMHSAELGER